MEDTGFSSYIGFRITALQRAAIERDAEAQKTSYGNIARQLMIAGGLDERVAFYFADDGAEKTDDRQSVLTEPA